VLKDLDVVGRPSMATTVQRLQSLYCGGTWLQNLEDRIGIAGAAQHCASHCGKDSIKPVTPVGQIASVTTRGAQGAQQLPSRISGASATANSYEFFPASASIAVPIYWSAYVTNSLENAAPPRAFGDAAGETRGSLRAPMIKNATLFAIVPNVMTPLIFDDAARDYVFSK
jgi:hypothetical protein